MNKEKLYEQKEIIIQDFDFEQIKTVFKLLGLKISVKTNNVEKLKTPTKQDLKSIASACFDKVIESDEKEQTISLCGFEAEKNGGELELRFVLQRVNLLGRKFGNNTQNQNSKIPIKKF